MKKYIVGLILTLTMLPSLASAQVATTTVDLTPEAKAALIAEIKAEIAALYQQMVIILQQQLADMQAKQDVVNNQIQSTLNQVVQNTTPVVTPITGGSTIPTQEQIPFYVWWTIETGTPRQGLRIESTVPINTDSVKFTYGTTTENIVSYSMIKPLDGSHYASNFIGHYYAVDYPQYIFTLDPVITSFDNSDIIKVKISLTSIDGREPIIVK